MPEPSNDSTTTPDFSREVYDSVHSDHTALNRLITSRLPLCLPPQTQNPLLYLQGLMVFGRIFEVLERRLAQEVQRDGSQDRITGALSLLEIPGLHRTERLQQDIHEIQLRVCERKLAPDDSMRNQATDSLENSVDRCVERPHLILAHAWAMYLALFNGGRWIRKQLRDAGEDFWMGPSPLAFWEFDGDRDGDDIHAQFKENFELAAQRLTHEERGEVVQEAREAFVLCSRLVRVLDKHSADDQRRKDAQKGEKGSGLRARLCSTFAYVGLLCLLTVVWSFLLQTNAIWKAPIPPAVAAKR